MFWYAVVVAVAVTWEVVVTVPLVVVLVIDTVDG